MAPIDFIVIAIIFALLAAALAYMFRRGGRCGGCPSAGSCAAASGRTCPVSDLTISRIERGLHDMTGTLGGESCGVRIPTDPVENATAGSVGTGGEKHENGSGKESVNEPTPGK